jgi:uncharacterized protein YigE (DUF2233 family)
LKQSRLFFFSFLFFIAFFSKASNFCFQNTSSSDSLHIGYQEILINQQLKFKVFAADSTFRFNIHLANLKSNNFSQALEEEPKAEFLMNAGMFHENYQPVGLLIKNGILIAKIDTINTPKYGNFYIQPNGVFLIDKSNKPLILTTRQFVNANFVISDIKMATQSGPMLIFDSKINTHFIEKSENRKIRNGVGVNKNGNVFFAISEKEVTFYEFSTFFKEQLNCFQALYLDGEISKIYIGEKGKKDNLSNMKFGPILSITK